MVKLLVYGYANGVVSSRKLERATYRDVAVRMLCADQHPDYRSIARFRARHLQALAELFVQALRLCEQAKLVGLGTLALDGTKLRANASRHKAMSYDRMGKAEAGLEAEIAAIRANVAALLGEAEAVDAAEEARYGPDRRGDELPEQLQRREQRLARIRAAKQALEAEAAAREAARRAELEAEGKKPRRPPKGRDPFTPKPSAQRNFTDPDRGRVARARGADRRRRLLLRGEHPDHRPARPRRAHRDRPLQALGATAAGATRTGPQKRHREAADGAQAENEEGPRHLRPSQDDRRARLRPDAHRPDRETAAVCAANPRRAPSGASTAPCTTCSRSTGPADST